MGGDEDESGNWLRDIFKLFVKFYLFSSILLNILRLLIIGMHSTSVIQ